METNHEAIYLQGRSGRELSLNSVTVAHLLVVSSHVAHLHEVNLNLVNLHIVYLPLY